jgi:hypothetical protein
MNPNELYRLIDLMPASGRMYCKVISKPEQPEVITAPFPLPWNETRPIAINPDLWQQLTQPQRDLLLLYTVSWLMSIQWFKFDLYQGLVAAGLAGTLLEALQADAAGIVTASGLTVLAAAQIWRKSRNTQTHLIADEKAIEVAQRRGYGEAEAAQQLLEAIEAVAQLENRPLSFTELIRCQNLRVVAGLSAVGVPERVRKEGG